MNEEYGSDFISITDEDGKEYELEVLAELEYEGSKYLALVPAEDNGEEDLEVSILKAVDENGEEILVTIDDDDELEAVYGALMDMSSKVTHLRYWTMKRCRRRWRVSESMAC